MQGKNNSGWWWWWWVETRLTEEFQRLFANTNSLEGGGWRFLCTCALPNVPGGPAWSDNAAQTCERKSRTEEKRREREQEAETYRETPSCWETQGPTSRLSSWCVLPLSLNEALPPPLPPPPLAPPLPPSYFLFTFSASSGLDLFPPRLSLVGTAGLLGLCLRDRAEAPPPTPLPHSDH